MEVPRIIEFASVKEMCVLETEGSQNVSWGLHQYPWKT